MSTRPLVLASSSPARLRLLREAGFDPSVIVSGFDEESITSDDPSELVRLLAEAKVGAVVGRVPEDALVVGCDSMLRFRDVSWGKPKSAAEAVQRWVAMSGQEGTLLTGHCIVDTRLDACVSEVAATTVRFGAPSKDELRAYAASGEPMGVAGGFTLDGRSAPFIEGIDGDPSNVIGLSLPLFRRLLGELGVKVTELWR